MKFSVLLCLLILCSIAAQAQTKATTEDGKKVILNADRTWKYAENSPGVTLKIEEPKHRARSVQRAPDVAVLIAYPPLESR